jgi:hypothetical protein
MASPDAIARVTRRLQAKLAAASGLGVTVLPLFKLDPPGQNPGLNLHLYRILPNAHWKNRDNPWKSPPGVVGQPPLALDLYYLLTATAPRPEVAQENLGAGMLVFHENPVLDPGGTAIAPFERARISMQPLSLDDMEKLWAGITTPRLLSVAYEVSIVLIESEKLMPSPLPVLTRGTGNDAIEVQAGLYPSIDRIEIDGKPFDAWLRRGSRAGRTVAQFDDKILVHGERLSAGEKAVIRPLRDPDPKKTMLCDLIDDGDGALVADLSTLDFAAAKFPAGPCSIAVQSGGAGGRVAETNAMPFSLAPKLDAISPNAGIVMPRDITVDFTPPFVGHETVVLIVGSSQLPPKNPTPGTSLTFALKGLPEEDFLSDPQDFPVRLRVDGVESFSVDLGKEIAQGARPTFANVIKVVKP